MNQNSNTNSLDNLDTTKLQVLSGLKQKKTRFQKAKENAEKKKKLEELETSQVYDDFIASFGTNGEKTAFRNSNNEEYEFKNKLVDNNKQTYAFSIHDLPPVSDRSNAHPSASNHSNKKVREIDSLFNEIKNRQHDPDTINQFEKETRSGSFPTGDKLTTNLHVGNLNPSLTGTNNQE